MQEHCIPRYQCRIAVTTGIGDSAIVRERFPSLDGNRAIAIGAVLLSHLAGTANFPLPKSAWAGRLGDFGVKIFFVLSGFLITGILHAERERTGQISISRFIARRAFRIFPAAYVYILAMGVAAAIGWLRLNPGDLFAAVTYTMNWHEDPAWWLGHTWSLSVEEQFYLAWPMLLLLSGRHASPLVAGAVLIAAPVVRLVLIVSGLGLDENIESSFVNACDGFAAGGLLALTSGRLEVDTTYLRFVLSKSAMLTLPAAFVLNLLDHRSRVFYGIAEPVIYISLAIHLHRCMLVPDDLAGRLLNSRALMWVGGLSYSLYLWQEPFLNDTASTALQTFPLNLVAALACAWVSYRCVERPFLRLRDRLLSSPSANAREPGGDRPKVLPKP
jgi:peptidoglycan/LPS O-acetylase OafA/YrhL